MDRFNGIAVNDNLSTLDFISERVDVLKSI